MINRSYWWLVVGNKEFFMKNVKRILSIISLTLVITLTLVSCGGGGGSGPAPALPAKEPQKTIYRSADAEGNVYRLEVIEKVAGRAAYAPQKGDTYVLTIIWKATKEKHTSSGTVETADGTLTLKPTVAPTVTFTITISGGGLTAISGTITFDPEDDKAAETKVISTPITLTVQPLTKIDEMDSWLAAKPANTPATAYSYKINVDDLEGIEGNILKYHSNKYVKLEFLQGAKTSFDGVFKDCKTIVSLIFPNNLTSIGAWNFVSCTNLTSVTLPNSLKEITGGNFHFCTSLTGITIPNGVTRIGNWSFSNCTSLTSITIPDSVTIIGQGAFDQCTSLSSVNIPNNVTKINFMAFFHTNITSVTIPASVISIGDIEDGDDKGGTFQDTPLTSVTFKRDGIELLGGWTPFPGDLGDKYSEGGAGTYTRPNRDDEVWTKK